MGLFDFFRPRWRHSDVEVRAEAVRQMGAADADLLARILRSDGDVRVRRIALKKIEDAELLAEVAESDADEGLRQAAADKASELLVAVAAGAGDEARRRRALDRITTQKALAEVAQRASIEGVRRAALARIADEKALAEVARGAKEPAMRREAVARLADAALLRDVALADPSRDVALAALAKLSDREALEAVARRARCRPARDAAREKLAEVTRPETPAGRSYGNLEAEAKLARRRARQVQLCRSVEALGNRNDLEQAERELLHARAAWQELGALAGEDLEMKARFDKACERFEQRRSEAARVHEAHVAEARTQAQPEPRAEAGDARQRRIEEQAAALVARIALCENVEALQGEEIPAKLEEARAAWNRLGAPPPERKAELERRFVRACAGAARRFDQRQAIAGARERLAALVEEAEKLAEAEKLQLAEQRLGHLR